MMSVVVALASSCLVRLASSGNVSLAPYGFTSGKMVKNFAGFGGWQVEDRHCDRFIYSRMWDEACMRRRPPAGEILPLLVTGSPFVGTRTLYELLSAMDVEAEHESYGEMATVSSVHGFNDFVGGVPYPLTDEGSRWWRKRPSVSQKFDFQNAFRPRFKVAVHVTRCPGHETKYSTGLQRARNRTLLTRVFNSTERTRREKTTHPKISQNDFDLTEIENFEVWLDTAIPLVVSCTGAARFASSSASWAPPRPSSASSRPSRPSRGSVAAAPRPTPATRPGRSASAGP